MTPRCFKCSQFRKGDLDFNFECVKLLQNDFRKQRYITLNATIPEQDRIYPKTHLCRTFLLSIGSQVDSKFSILLTGCWPNTANNWTYFSYTLFMHINASDY